MPNDDRCAIFFFFNKTKHKTKQTKTNNKQTNKKKKKKKKHSFTYFSPFQIFVHFDYFLCNYRHYKCIVNLKKELAESQSIYQVINQTVVQNYNNSTMAETFCRCTQYSTLSTSFHGY